MPRTRLQIFSCHLAGCAALIKALVRPVRRKDLPVPEFSIRSTEAAPSFLVLAEFDDDETSWEEFDNFTEASDAFDFIRGNDEDVLRVRLRSSHAHCLDWASPGYPEFCPQEGAPYLILAEELDGTRMFEFHNDWHRAQGKVLTLQESGASFIELRRSGQPTLCWSHLSGLSTEPPIAA